MTTRPPGRAAHRTDAEPECVTCGARTNLKSSAFGWTCATAHIERPPRMPILTVAELIRRLETIEDKTALVTCSVPIPDSRSLHRTGPVKGMTTGFDPDYGPSVNIWASRPDPLAEGGRAYDG